ncbi:VCBS domain-containing protein [Oceanimonas sp. NS1]|nr:VCBS domain-containing protein [Oceanimonas sp. NS1]
MSNDSDVDEGDSKTVTAIRTGAEGGSGTSGTVGSVLAGQYGSLTLNADGTYSYVVDESNADVQALRQSGQILTESFTYTLSDTAGLTDSATLTITIEGRNDAPVAVDDSASAIEAGGIANGTTGNGASGNVLSNDTDVDEGDSKTVTAIRTGVESGSGTSGTVGSVLVGQYGSLTLNADGTYSYVVDESNADVQALRQSGQTLSESFTYTVTDSAGLTDSATLTITIDGRNDAPVAVATPGNERSNFGVDYRFDVGRLFTDADGAAYGEELTIVVEGLPQGLRYDAVQG